MSDALNVYATCPACRRVVGTFLAPSGTRYLMKHGAGRRNKPCMATGAQVTGLPGDKPKEDVIALQRWEDDGGPSDSTLF